MAKILIIDDEEILRQLMEHVLSGDGHETITAEDGVAGIVLAKSDAPDLIISDMSMPKMTGWDMVKALKADPTTKDIPIIALTAHATADDRAAAFDAGISTYEEKPLDMARLKKHIAELIG
jgi:CheY-like chemotaxis protein